ncbi:hypothetical protein vseg_020432 [Gypsophila vaccaria]
MFRPSMPTLVAEGQPLAMSWVGAPRFEADNKMLGAYRQQLDGLTAESVRWLPYGPRPDRAHPRTLFSGCNRYMDIVEAYQPDRCMQQFGYVQIIPVSMPCRGKFYRPGSAKGYCVDYGKYADHTWVGWPHHRVDLSSLSRWTVMSADVHPRYMRWFRTVSRPLIIDPDSSEGQLAAQSSDGYREVSAPKMDAALRSGFQVLDSQAAVVDVVVIMDVVIRIYVSDRLL